MVKQYIFVFHEVFFVINICNQGKDFMLTLYIKLFILYAIMSRCTVNKTKNLNKLLLYLYGIIPMCLPH